MKGVLMLVNEFPPLPVGGAERQAEYLAAYMAHQGLWVGVLTRRVDQLPKVERRDGFRVIRISQFGPGKFKSLTFILNAALMIFCYRQKFDILHAHLAFAPAVVAAIAGRFLNKKVIIKFGNSGYFGDVETSNRTYRGRLALWILRKWANVVVTLSEEMEKELLGAGFPPNRIVRMVNGVDVKKFTPPVDRLAAKESITMTGRTVLLFTGRLEPQKALDILLLAFQCAVKNIPNLHLIIVGDGSERDKLLEMIVDLGIQSQVTLIRYVEDIRPYLNGSDIFVLPSLIEGISNSLLEAMASGSSCIATRVGGSGEVLGGGAYGLLIEPNNVGQLSDAISRFASNQEEAVRFGVRSRQRAVDYYDFSVVGNRYFLLYREMIGGH